MLNKEQSQAIEVPKRVMLIIFSALVLGTVFFAVIASFVRLSGNEPLLDMEFGVFEIVGVAFAALVFLPSILVPMFMQRGTIKETANQFAGKLHDAKAATKLAAGMQTSMIVGLALLDGAAFFILLAFMLDGSVYSLIVAAFLLFFMLVRIPLPERVENKIVNMLDDAKHV